MLASFLIIGFSLALLGYWFRYSCILLLRNSAEQAVAVQNQEMEQEFAFVQVRELLPAALHLDPLHKALDRDYQLLTYLAQHAAGLDLTSLEDRMLVWDYKLMQVWYRATRALAPEFARSALSEMTTVMGILVSRITPVATEV